MGGQQKPDRLGLWLVGARGNVAVTVATGLAALRHQLTGSIGLCTETAPFDGYEFAEFGDIVLGGHELRDGQVIDVLDRLTGTDRTIDPALREGVAGDLQTYQESIVRGASEGRERERLVADMRAFVSARGLDRLVVVNLASTEPLGGEQPTTESSLREAADSGSLPMSSVYALAALEAGAAYINFTPSAGASAPVFDVLASERGLLHAGRDGKTGETLLKAALLPMFAARNLRVQSWFGQNILGNADGRTLQDPRSKSAKQSTKAGLVEAVLGYQPESHVGIDYVGSLGDWKVAWDHVLFSGFLGTQMNLQLTWQGADSILAAPLVIDLARISDFCLRRGDKGLVSELGFFFKEPLGSAEHALMDQYRNLLRFLGTRS